MRSQIIGTGSYAPAKVLTNADLEKMVDTNDEWIVTRTGIRERRIAAEDEATSDLAYHASMRALEMAGVAADSVDLIVVGTVTPDMPFPSAATILQGRLGNKKGFAFDVSAACAGSLFALGIADRYIASGAAKYALVVGADILSRLTDWTDRATCVLFGDAAGAMVLAPSASRDRGVLSTHLHTDGSHWPILHIPGGGSRAPFSQKVLDEKLHSIRMNGREVYKIAVRTQYDSCREALELHKMSAGDVNHVIAHQANLRIIEGTLERLGIPMSKCWTNIEKYGNTSSASLPTTLDEANRAGILKQGDIILMMAAGAGMTWGSAVVRW
jgi:3-oxoacyl-[acyl-carrier-protein] synthase-3